jgi:ankyrin repeat protein
MTLCHLMAVGSVLLLAGCGDSRESSPSSTSSAATSGAAANSETSRDSRAGAGLQGAPSRALKTARPTPQISEEAFRLAAHDGRLDSVRGAVESGIDVNSADASRALTALHMAAFNGHVETVKYLLEKGAVVDCRDSEGKTPLIHACTGPFAAAARVLIEAGADVNARESTEGFTPLMMAAGLGQPEVVRLLLEKQADKSLLDQDQESAADHARNSGHAEIVEILK